MRLLTASQVSMLVPLSNGVEVTQTDRIFRNDASIVNAPALTPTQVTNLTVQQLQAMTPAQLASLTPAQLAALTSEQIAALSAAQLAGLQLALTGQGPGSGGTSGGTIATGAPTQTNSGTGAGGSGGTAAVRPWASNQARIPIDINVQTEVAVLNASVQRNFLLIQNNSSATSPDVAPNLLVSLDGPVNTAQPAQYVNIDPAGFGIFFDTRVPSNAIFLAWGSLTGSPIVGAVVWAGYAP